MGNPAGVRKKKRIKRHRREVARLARRSAAATPSTAPSKSKA